MRLLTFISALVIAASFDARAQPELPSIFKARDIDGIRLDMTLPEVMAIFDGKLEKLSGSGVYRVDRGDTSFRFDFSVRDRLYLVESNQKLGSFTPDQPFMSALGEKLKKKYGVSGRFYAGTAGWSPGEKYGDNLMFWRPTESLDVSVRQYFGEPTTLVIMLMDLRIERRDIKLLNDGPAAKGSKAIRF